MIQTILVPTDFSNNAFIATRYALGLARDLGINVHILHAYQPFTSAFQSPLANESDEMRMKGEAEKRMAAFLKALDDTSGVGIRYEIVKQPLMEAIQTQLVAHEKTLLVMGTHGASGTRKELLGSNTYDVAKRIEAPMLIVPEKTVAYQISRIAFFTDYLRSDVHTLRELRRVAPGPSANCTLIHIESGEMRPTGEDVRRLEDWRIKLAKESGFEQLAAQLVHGKETLATVSETIQSLNADLLVLTLAGVRSFFERLMRKSLARAIILNAQTPVFLAAREGG